MNSLTHVNLNYSYFDKKGLSFIACRRKQRVENILILINFSDFYNSFNRDVLFMSQLVQRWSSQLLSFTNNQIVIETSCSK